MKHGKSLIVWILVAVVYVGLAASWISTNDHDKAFADYMSYAVQAAGNERRPPKELRKLLLQKADSLDIPLDRDAIQITGEGRSLRTVVNYEADIRLPMVNKPIYRVAFNHDVSYHSLF